MSKFENLMRVSADSLFRGGVFRVSNVPGYEKWVDLMLFETQDEHNPYGLVVSSGYKAGLILVRFPLGCISEGGGLDREWIINNWSFWVVPDGDVSEVYFSNGYESSIP